MIWSHDKLKGKIAEKGYTYEKMSEFVGCTPSTFCLKMNNKSEFTPEEIYRIMKALDIREEELYKYFFTLKVSNANTSGGD